MNKMEFEDNDENIQLDTNEQHGEHEQPIENVAAPPAKKRVKKVKIVAHDDAVDAVDADIPKEHKPKRTVSEKQRQNWEKALEARKANILRRKQEREEAEKKYQEELKEKIVLKAKRIIKAESRVLGNIDELKKDDVEDIVIKPKAAKKQRMKKQIIVYNNDTTDNDDDDSDYEPVKKSRRRHTKVTPEPVYVPIVETRPPQPVIQFI